MGSGAASQGLSMRRNRSPRPRSKRRAGLSASGQKELDGLARTLVMLRAGAAEVALEKANGSGFLTAWWGRCERCERERWLSWCHGVTRGTRAVRWDGDNAWAWCSGCHRWMDQHAEEKREWIIERIGAERWGAVVMRSRTGRPYYAAIRVALTEEIKRMTRGGVSE